MQEQSFLVQDYQQKFPSEPRLAKNVFLMFARANMQIIIR